MEVDDVDLIHLEPRWGFSFQFAWQKRLIYRDVSGSLVFQNPGLHRVKLKQEYDLFVAVCQNHADLLHVNAIEGWEDFCKTSVCWLDEMWAVDLPLMKHWLPALRRFDHVFIGCNGTIGALSGDLGRPCHWLPGGADTIRFSPYPNPPVRVIDVYGIGRRREGIHRALLRSAANNEIFYLYDSFPEIAELEPYDYRHHRDLFANLLKRSRYFMVAPGKFDSNEHLGQVEIGYRYFEGVAGGAILIGETVAGEGFREMFPWPNAVVPVQPDGSDACEVLASLNSDPHRVSAISRRNAAEALLRHDWVHRWKEIFRYAGVAPSPALRAREQRLQELASLALAGQAA
ncbi:MAG: glycosyltransferase family 1 protein [Bryobacterales bacterium]|nr:glycosyltransferase family 1 protein [Bryobacterales bacterium]